MADDKFPQLDPTALDYGDTDFQKELILAEGCLWVRTGMSMRLERFTGQ